MQLIILKIVACIAVMYGIVTTVYIHKLKHRIVVVETESADNYAKQMHLKYNVEMQKEQIKELEEGVIQANDRLEKIQTGYEEYIQILNSQHNNLLEDQRDRLNQLEAQLSELNSKPMSLEEVQLEKDNQIISFNLGEDEKNIDNKAIKNQKVLDDYIKREKTLWEKKRDYKLYIGFLFRQKRFQVQYISSTKKRESTDKDLIAQKGKQIILIKSEYCNDAKETLTQCVNALGKAMEAYSFEHKINKKNIKGMFYSNIGFTDIASKLANSLGIILIPYQECGEFPRIKCNIGRDENGKPVKIYHLPVDQQYDRVKIELKGECFVETIAEAEKRGFRRAYRHIQF